MNNHNVIVLYTPEPLDPLQEALKRGAQSLLRKDVERGLKFSLAEHSSLKSEDGRQAMLRNGYLPELSIHT